ncbi:MAG TPA: YMGG-like glycine zipper-containing protein [Terriglobia bacterium]|nr:YMGG-like glycine zipper-containing protein [Terriglobia bacterium]
MNFFKTRNFWAAAITVCFLVPLLHADSIKFKNGQTVQGKYLGGTDSQVTFYTNNQLMHYAIADIDSIVFGGPAATPSAAAPAVAPAPVIKEAAAPAQTASTTSGANVLVPAGTHIVVRMIDGINSDQNKVGDTFQASLEDPLIVDSTQVAAKGTTVYGKLEQVKSAGRIQGQSELRLVLTGIMLNGSTHNIVTGDYEVQGSSRGHQTAKRAGIGALAGGVIGAIAGGGKGAAIGAGVGAGAGTAVSVMTHGQQVHVPSETVLDFTLEQPVQLPISNG